MVDSPSLVVFILNPVPKPLLMFCGVSHLIFTPSLIMQICVPIFSASSIYYVEMRIARLEVLFSATTKRERRRHIFSLDLKSKLEVGSSMIMSFASPIRDIAMESLRHMP